MPKNKSIAAAEPASKRRVQPRAPSRSAGVIRYASLLSAVEALLQEGSPEDIGLYQIAERAGASPASVYHFFPTKEAAFLALAQRHLDAFAQLGREPIAVAHLGSWQDLVAWDLRKGVAYYNANPSASKLFLGGFGSLETRQADRQYVERAAKAAYRRLNLYFHMPYLRDAVEKCHISIQIIDAILSSSYIKHGEVTDYYYDEALAACVAYCRTFLPERLEQRQAVQEAIARGDHEILILDEDDDLAESTLSTAS